MPNVFDPEFAPDEEQHGFFRRRAFVGRDAGAQRLGATVVELPPGKTASPYHWHFGNEEMAVVVHGTPSLKTPAGWRELATGEVVSFPVGEKGAHQISNFSGSAARVLLISEMNSPDVCGYPDSGKLAAMEGAPGPARSGLWEIYRRESAVDYWEGEAPPSSPDS